MAEKSLAVATFNGTPSWTPEEARNVSRMLTNLAVDLKTNPVLLDGTRWFGIRTSIVSVSFTRHARRRHAEQLATWLQIKATELRVKARRQLYSERFRARYLVG